MITEKLDDFCLCIEDKKGPLLGIDFGRKNVGIAISDDLRRVAMPLVILENNKDLVKNIHQILVDSGCVGVVAGWPVNLNGGVHAMGKDVLFLCGNLYKLTTLPALVWDESMSTKLAVANVYGLAVEKGDKLINKIGKGRDDHLAAQFVLSHVLDCLLYDRKA